MTVSELIQELSKLTQDAPVYIVYDGEPRMKLGFVAEAKRGPVIVCGFSEAVYKDVASFKNLEHISNDGALSFTTPSDPEEGIYDDTWDYE